MCGHLVAKGYPVTVYSRTRERAAGLVEQGAVWADSPAQVAAVADVVFTMVGFPADVRDVFFGERGVLRSLRPDAVAVDMTTTEPRLAIEIASAAAAKGAAAVDAPVSGGDVGARNATLSIMVGGAPDAVARVMPFF
jgi:3-hydroxyisobutyrate dehydrogenase